MSPRYSCVVKNWQDKTLKMTISAANRNDALNHLRFNNVVLLSLKESKDYRQQMENFLFNILSRLGYAPYSSRDLMIFCRQFSTMLRAGITILQCLKILAEQVEIAALNKLIRSVSNEVEQGLNLASAFQTHEKGFPLILVNMIEVGETSGSLDKVMEGMTTHFEKQHDLQQNIRSATLYPIFIISVSLVVVSVMVVFVLPQFSQIFNSLGMEMPLFTRLILSIGNLIRERWLLIILFLIISITALSCYINTAKGREKYDHIRLCFPLFGKIYRQTIAARFARMLATLLAGGVTLHAALALAGKAVDNVVIAKAIEEITRAVTEGETVTVPLKKINYFPPLLSEMVRIGEETGSLENTLQSTADFYEREVSYYVKHLSTILEPALLLFVGLFIGLLVFSILSPMYRIFEMI